MKIILFFTLIVLLTTSQAFRTERKKQAQVLKPYEQAIYDEVGRMVSSKKFLVHLTWLKLLMFLRC